MSDDVASAFAAMGATRRRLEQAESRVAAFEALAQSLAERVEELERRLSRRGSQAGSGAPSAGERDDDIDEAVEALEGALALLCDEKGARIAEANVAILAALEALARAGETDA